MNTVSIMYIKWVLVNLIGYRNIENMVVGLENLALNKPTRQSSNYDDNRFSDKAVDGIISTHGDTCAVTNQPTNKPNWLIVDLNAKYEISSVSVLSRGDCCADQLSNFIISVWRYDPGPHIKYNMAEADYCVCAKHPSVARGGQWTDLTCMKICTGRFVLLLTNNPNDVLTVCEFRVFGIRYDDCPTSHLPEMHIKKKSGIRSGTPNCPPFPHQVSNIYECIDRCLKKYNCISFNYSPHLLNTINCELVTCFSHPEQDFTVESDWNWRYLK